MHFCCAQILLLSFEKLNMLVFMSWESFISKCILNFDGFVLFHRRKLTTQSTLRSVHIMFVFRAGRTIFSVNIFFTLDYLGRGKQDQKLTDFVWMHNLTWPVFISNNNNYYREYSFILFIYFNFYFFEIIICFIVIFLAVHIRWEETLLLELTNGWTHLQAKYLYYTSHETIAFAPGNRNSFFIGYHAWLPLDDGSWLVDFPSLSWHCLGGETEKWQLTLGDTGLQCPKARTLLVY